MEDWIHNRENVKNGVTFNVKVCCIFDMSVEIMVSIKKTDKVCSKLTIVSPHSS